MSLLNRLTLLCAAQSGTALVLNTLKSATVLDPAMEWTCDLRRRPGVDEDEQARERQAPEALEDDEVRGPSWTRTSIVPATA